MSTERAERLRLTWIEAYPGFRNWRPGILQGTDFAEVRRPRSAPQDDRSYRPGNIPRGDPGWRLSRQTHLQLPEQERLIRFGFCVAREDDGAAIRRRQMHVDHLDRGHLVQHRP